MNNVAEKTTVEIDLYPVATGVRAALLDRETLRFLAETAVFYSDPDTNSGEVAATRAARELATARGYAVSGGGVDTLLRFFPGPDGGWRPAREGGAS